MDDYDRICCPIDFSEPSRRAMQEAARLARKHEASLTLLHVAEPVHHGAEMAFSPPAWAAEEAGARELAAWKAEAEAITGEAVATVLLSGPPAPAIVGFARDAGVDLIVTASHGRTGVRRIVLGSVSEQVIRTAPCDVLVVRHEVEARPAKEREDAGAAAGPVGMPA
jgi:nucleotide-binding universal stress UspA family protein